MARFTAVVETDRPIEDAFAYLADFSNAEEWDPGTESAIRLDDGPIREGSRFELTVSFAGRQTSLVYELTDMREPNRIVLLGQNSMTRSLDTITLAPVGAKTRITYDAVLTLKGLAKPFQPMLQLVFPKLGREAAEGLRQAMNGELVHSD